MSEMTAMDNEMPETLRTASRDEEAVAQGLVANKAERQTPGEMLREARISHDYSVADLCAQTMLSKRTIEALEDNSFEALSQPVFARGYYRKCAKVLGMDADALMAAYATSGGARRAATPAPIVGVNVVPADVTPDRRRTFGVFFLILILLIAAFAVYLFWTERSATRSTAASDGGGITLTAPFGGQDTGSADANGDTNGNVDGKPVPSPLSEPLGEATGDAAADAAPDATAAQDTPADAAQPAGTAATPSSADDGAQAAKPAADDESASEEAAAGADASAAETAAAGGVAASALTLQFKERSWVSVHDATGKQLLVGIYEDTSRTLDGRPPYRLVIGYGPGVDVRLGDKAIDFKVADNQTARFSVGSDSQ